MEIIQIKNLDELKKRKIKPEDLNKKFVDETGQEYKLKFDTNTQKIKIIKIVKAVLDGTFIRSKYSDIASDEQVKEAFKDEFTKLGKNYLDEKISKDSNPEETKQDNADINSSDEIILQTFSDVEKIIEKIKERKDVMFNLIDRSNVLNGNFDYEDELLLRDIRRMMETDIINEYDLNIEKYNDVLNGIYDSQVKLKMYNNDIKKNIEGLEPKKRLKILREYYAVDTFLSSMGHIMKTFEDIKYKLENLPDVKLDVKNYTERQMFKDAIFTLKTCEGDSDKIKIYLKKQKNELFSKDILE